MSGKNTLNDDWVTSVARAFRLATIQNLYDNRLVTKEEAEDLLRGPLVPDDETTFFDDSHQLKITE